MKTHPIKYIETFTNKNWKFQIKFWYLSYFFSKHRLWVLLELPQCNEYPQSMILSRNKENDVYPGKPLFYYIKVGFKEDRII